MAVERYIWEQSKSQNVGGLIMTRSHGYQFFMQEVDKKGNLVGTKKDLEQDFDGLKYSSLVGIDHIGATKNVYTETYADANRVRVSMPTDVKHESTQLMLTLYFMGQNRSAVFKEFCDYICNGIHRYWDTARNRYFDFYVAEELSPSDELWYSSTPYFKVDVKMNNIFGKTYTSHEEVVLAY